MIARLTRIPQLESSPIGNISVLCYCYQHMRLFDAHCHIQDERLASGLDATLKRARTSGVMKMLCCGTSETDWQRVATLCNRNSALIPAFGLHPWHVQGRSSTWMTALTDSLLSDPAAAVGEIGLDHAIKERNDDAQTEVFIAQLRLAKALDRPACIHCRRAWDIIIQVLEDMDGLPAGFLIHSYSGPVELIELLAGMGAYFSFSGTITRQRNQRGHTAVVAVPMDRLLIETDSPDLTPVLPSTTPESTPQTAEAPNEPANLVHVMKAVAQLRKMTENDVADVTYNNACRLFTCRQEAPEGRAIMCPQ